MSPDEAPPYVIPDPTARDLRTRTTRAIAPDATDHSQRGRAFLASSGLLFSAAIGLQLVANERFRRDCITARAPDLPTRASLSQCLVDHPGLVGIGFAASFGSLASIGLAAGAGWEFGASPRQANPRRQRVLRAVGSTLLGLGVAGYAAIRIGLTTSWECTNIECHERQRETDLVARNVGALLTASGASLLTASARGGRVKVQPMRLARGAGINLTVQLP